MESTQNRDPIKVFISYSHQDKEFRQQLEAHLSVLQREGIVLAWHDQKIWSGSEWSSEIDAHLHTAHIVLLMVSPDFFNSDYCYTKEMQWALKQHHSNRARVIPIIIRPSDWTNSPLGKLQALPNGKPVTSWANRDEAFLDIVKGIRAVIDHTATSESMHATHQETLGNHHKPTAEMAEASTSRDRWWTFGTRARLLAISSLIVILFFLLLIPFARYDSPPPSPKHPYLVEGQITRITSKFIELNIGSKDGVYQGMPLSVLGHIEDIEGEVLVGELQVSHVEKHESRAIVVERTAPFRKGWKVQE